MLTYTLSAIDRDYISANGHGDRHKFANIGSLAHRNHTQGTQLELRNSPVLAVLLERAAPGTAEPRFFASRFLRLNTHGRPRSAPPRKSVLCGGLAL